MKEPSLRMPKDVRGKLLYQDVLMSNSCLTMSVFQVYSLYSFCLCIVFKQRRILAKAFSMSGPSTLLSAILAHMVWIPHEDHLIDGM